jgi:hypothetical protein
MRTNLLIFDKDAEIARCCADSTVPISVPTQRCLLNGADLGVYSTVPTQRCLTGHVGTQWKILRAEVKEE